ncbi:MAG: VCBS repeat-containing protein [Paracoccaceae bacterium]
MRSALLLTLLASPCLAETVVDARYSEPTSRYAHGVLGDAIEWGALEITLASGEIRTFRLPETRVFEDLAPRMQDLDGDGTAEIIVVEADAELGAQLAIYGAQGKITATPHIGRAYRWLAPVGAADIDGDGVTEIAFVDRPHLRKSLEVYKYRDGTLSPWARFGPVTNHLIGQDYISGGIRDCAGGPEIVVARADWLEVLTLTWAGDAFEISRQAPNAGPESFARALSCSE